MDSQPDRASSFCMSCIRRVSDFGIVFTGNNLNKIYLFMFSGLYLGFQNRVMCSLSSQEDEGGNDTTLVSQENVIKFLDDTFRKRYVKIKDYFPNLHDFMKTARSMIRDPYQVNMSDPQFQRLRKCVTRVGKELQE